MIRPIHFFRAMKKHEPLLFWFLLFFVLMVIIGVVGGAKHEAAEQQCLEKGYREARTMLAGFGKAYCMKRVDQTDVVVPLDSL